MASDATSDSEFQSIESAAITGGSSAQVRCLLIYCSKHNIIYAGCHYPQEVSMLCQYYAPGFVHMQPVPK
jgi:hypothetical protein